jgi:hypothetical protein
MSRAAIILAVIIASASIARAEPATAPDGNAAETPPAASTDHPAETTTHVHHHYHHRRHHRFHPVHDASELFHHATGTEPVYPKPVNN